MKSELVERIASALLYEGYILYPYRPSAIKNRQRWNFGVLYPESYCLAEAGTDASSMQTECLALASAQTTIDVKIRFLHLLARDVAVLVGSPLDATEPVETSYRVVDSLEVGDQVFHTWQEAVEREVSAQKIALSEIAAEPLRLKFTFPASRHAEPLRDKSGHMAGALIRKQECVEGELEVRASRAGEELFKLTVRVLNLTLFDETGKRSRDEALMRSLVSTHTILSVREGEFISLLDPPEAYVEAAGLCRNMGTWPVLVGEEGERDSMLSSPIIIYDYPQVAPESAGDLFDSTEIDEILMLRIMTLTDEEKREMRQVDDRSRKILERTESLPAEHFMKMHGAVRSLRPIEKDER